MLRFHTLLIYNSFRIIKVKTFLIAKEGFFVNSHRSEARYYKQYLTQPLLHPASA